MGELFIRCKCGARLRVPSKYAGKSARCPRCQNSISAPQPIVFELWDGEEISFEDLQSIERYGVRDGSITREGPAGLSSDCTAAIGHVPDQQLAAEFNGLVGLLETHADHPLLNSPISEWTEPSDSSPPFKFLDWSIRRVLETPYVRIASSWTSDERLRCLVNHLERARQAIESRTGCPDENELDGTPSRHEASRKLAVTGGGWRTYCEIVERHNLQPLWLGMVAQSLERLPSTFWTRQIGEFSTKTLSALSEMQGLGPKKMNIVIDIFRELAMHLESIPSGTHLATCLIPKPIQNVNLWLEEVLGEERIPDVEEIATRFMRPLAVQLRIDLTEEVASMVMRRMGTDGASETLEEIAKDVGCTRERVRQLTKRATEVLRVRWPHGKHLLDDLYDLLRSAAGTQQQLEFVRTILDRCFDVEFTKGATRGELLSAWRRAARKRLTPMNEQEMAAWLAPQFPRIAPEVGVGWIREEALKSRDDSGQTWYFSDEPLDQILHKLYEERIAVTMREILDLVDGEERSLAGRIARDPRFVEIDDKRIHASHHCSIERHSGVWQLQLSPSAQAAPTVDAIPIENLVQLLIGGMTQAGIADATVWGVHRFTNEVLGRLYGAALPESVSPIVLQDLLTGHSNGMISRMRRRRLRWDCADKSIAVRGKRGWVGYAVRKADLPMTLEELGTELRRYYQDYEFYVLQQLSLIDDEEGEGLRGVVYFPGVPHRVPPIVVSDSWKLDVARENVSDAIKLIAGKIVDVGRRKGFPKSDLEQIPWLIELVDHYAFGKMQWSEAGPSTDEILRATDRVAVPTSTLSPASEGPESVSTDDSEWAVDEDSEQEGATLDSIMEQLNELL